MKRYRFNLESVLRVRRVQEDRARQDLAQSNRMLVSARWALADASRHYSEVTVPAGLMDQWTFRFGQLKSDLAAAEVERRHRMLVEAAVTAATQHARWTEAAKMVAALERLEERRRDEWRAEALRGEAAAVDDVVTSRWIAEEERSGRRPVGPQEAATHLSPAVVAP